MLTDIIKLNLQSLKNQIKNIEKYKYRHNMSKKIFNFNPINKDLSDERIKEISRIVVGGMSSICVLKFDLGILR